jgi:hypothetical protein
MPAGQARTSTGREGVTAHRSKQRVKAEPAGAAA